ncbi:MAG: LCP family protein [Euryarchaeota archaeon]|nr:LCP family protein [Euryarchaeota archaeon]MBU4547332.1 LCP family protein [Euryarchaeota archaeon]MBU4608429.1 LCP family protein [Euryarchaeota archaeon]MBV1755995.1 LCP family protein [Methanobacterium sp.]MBV1768098.1 LCP family protein [Methanobacterium sp.]
MKNWQKLLGILSLILIIGVALSFLVFINESESSDRINILLLGSDDRTGQMRGNTDSMSVLSIDKITTEVSLLSIPRDSRVDIPGRGVDKINSAYPYGDIDTTIETVENFLDIRIDYYILVDFNEFKEMVDTLGGITLDVEPHVASAVPELHGKSGINRLNGEEALAYLRFRFDEDADPGRVRRHQKAIQSIIQETLSPSNIMDAPAILNQLRKNVRTNIPPMETTLIETLLQGFEIENSKTAAITGEWTTINGIVYLIPDRDKTEEMVVELGLRE